MPCTQNKLRHDREFLDERAVLRRRGKRADVRTGCGKGDADFRPSRGIRYSPTAEIPFEGFDGRFRCNNIVVDMCLGKSYSPRYARDDIGPRKPGFDCVHLHVIARITWFALLVDRNYGREEERPVFPLRFGRGVSPDGESSWMR